MFWNSRRKKTFKLFNKIIAITILTIGIFFLCVAGFIWWNCFPPLPSISSPPIKKYNSHPIPPPPSELKVVTYNIHYSSGVSYLRKGLFIQEDGKAHLNKIAKTLKLIDADIVILQEVDFRSKRSDYVNQAEYLSQISGYAYVAIAPQIQRRLFPEPKVFPVPLSHGLAILSRFPIETHESRLFELPSEIPFYVRWVLARHGMQKVTVRVGRQIIALINLHLEPWSQKLREAEVKQAIKWIKEIPNPIIIGGDFNTLPPEATNKIYFHLEDTPWFIDKSNWDLEYEKTILMMRDQGFTEAIPSYEYLKNEASAFTYPSDNPIERLDYLFAGNVAKVVAGYVFFEAGIASDHLPLVGEIEYPHLENVGNYVPRIAPIAINPTSQNPQSSK